jgi:ABC-type nitrate/sulfonate/bicarbonate transport system substrate-binding protein
LRAISSENYKKTHLRYHLFKQELVLAVIVLTLASSYSSTTLAATRDLERVRIGYSVGGLIPFPLIVAKENRFFEQAGFDAELINIPPTIAVTALVSGDIQYVNFAGTTLNAAVRGLPVKLVMIYNDRPLFSLMSRPDIRSIRDLRGKVLGVATLTSGESFLSRRLLKDAGIDVEKEMTLRVIGNTPDRLQALRAGAVDVTTLTLPVDIHAERLGLRRLVFMGDTMESINGGFGVSESWLQKRPDQIKKMIAVAFRGMGHARSQRQDSIALIMSKWRLEREVAEKAFDMMIKTWTDSGVASDQALQAGIDESLKISNTKQPVPISRVADFSLAREVYRELKGK